MFRLVDTGWSDELTGALRDDPGELRIVAPFIKLHALERLLSMKPKKIQVITRYNLDDFAKGVSDIKALRALLETGAQVRGIKGLHAKLYVFGQSRAVITSANLTKAALDSNHEFGVVSDDVNVISACRAYFDEMWKLGRNDLKAARLDQWQTKVSAYLASGAKPGKRTGLGDYGAEAGKDESPAAPSISISDAPQAFVKFLGESSNRVGREFRTFEEVERGGCHWAVAYPKLKRPRAVQDGAIMYIARLTDEPDIRIFGRAVGMAYVEGRDDASEKDIELREWKEIWPRYIRVHDAEFVAGTMANGVSLNELMDTLGADSFAPTQRNAAKGVGNTNPRKAYLQQAAVELSPQGFAWVAEKLEAAFQEHGKIPADDLNKLDWPVLSRPASKNGG